MQGGRAWRALTLPSARAESAAGKDSTCRNLHPWIAAEQNDLSSSKSHNFLRIEPPTGAQGPGGFGLQKACCMMCSGALGFPSLRWPRPRDGPHAVQHQRTAEHCRCLTSRWRIGDFGFSPHYKFGQVALDCLHYDARISAEVLQLTTLERIQTIRCLGGHTHGSTSHRLSLIKHVPILRPDGFCWNAHVSKRETSTTVTTVCGSSDAYWSMVASSTTAS